MVYLRAMVRRRKVSSRSRRGSAPPSTPPGPRRPRRPVPRVLDGADVVQAQHRGRTLPHVVPAATATLDNYRRVFEREFFWTAMRNSAMVTVTVVVLALVIAFFAAVALSRFRFRGRKPSSSPSS